MESSSSWDAPFPTPRADYVHDPPHKLSLQQSTRRNAPHTPNEARRSSLLLRRGAGLCPKCAGTCTRAVLPTGHRHSGWGVVPIAANHDQQHDSVRRSPWPDPAPHRLLLLDRQLACKAPLLGFSYHRPPVCSLGQVRLLHMCRQGWLRKRECAPSAGSSEQRPQVDRDFYRYKKTCLYLEAIQSWGHGEVGSEPFPGKWRNALISQTGRSVPTTPSVRAYPKQPGVFQQRRYPHTECACRRGSTKPIGRPIFRRHLQHWWCLRPRFSAWRSVKSGLQTYGAVEAKVLNVRQPSGGLENRADRRSVIEIIILGEPDEIGRVPSLLRGIFDSAHVRSAIASRSYPVQRPAGLHQF